MRRKSGCSVRKKSMKQPEAAHSAAVLVTCRAKPWREGGRKEERERERERERECEREREREGGMIEICV